MKNLFAPAGLALAALLATTLLTRAQAQGVRIGSAGTPDASAVLDLVSSTKGALLPRVATVTDVPSPATGLVVFQTGGTPGYYYNTGTPSTPSWQQLATVANAASAASGLFWGLSGNANTANGAKFLGTTDAQDLVFKTNGVEAMRLT